MNVIFSADNPTQDSIKFIHTIITKVSKIISLPDRINITLKSMGPSTYGETIVSYRPTATIVLNSDLTPHELFYPIIHELVHIHQIHTRQLSVTRTGVYIWSGSTYIVDPQTMSYKDYQHLPWELDAHRQQAIIGKKLLENQ